MAATHSRSLLLLHLLACMPCVAQTDQDALWRTWRNEQLHDTVRVRALSNYAWHGFLFSLPDSAEYYGQMMYDFADRRGLEKYKAYALRGLGVVYKVRGADAKALDLWLRSMRMSEAINDLAGVAGSVNNIGIMYEEQGDVPRALEYHRRSLALREQCNDSIGVGASLASIGRMHRLEGNLDSAMLYGQRSLAQYERIGYLLGVGLTRGDIGDVYAAQKEYVEAVDHYERSLQVLTAMNNPMAIAERLARMGVVRSAMGLPHDAEKACAKSLSLATAVANPYLQQEACDCLYAAHKAMGHRDQALYYLERSQALDDTLQMDDLAKRLQRMEFTKELYADSVLQAERDQREAVVVAADLSREKNRKHIYQITGVAILLLVAGLLHRLRFIRRSHADIEREKNLNEELLHNILPEEVAEELRMKGFAAARNFEHASVLFSDFEGFTQLSERMTAAELVAEIAACFEAFDAIMDLHGIEKIKTIGDAYMAAGGLPIPTDGSVRDTVLAGLDMQDFITRRNVERSATGKPAFQMRLGIHTGPVVAGIVGVRKFQYDIWGDTVNTANRMESCGEVGRVNISGATYTLVNNEPGLSFTPRGKVQAKGKGEMEMYFVGRSGAVA